ncbi:MAG: hypothetical protein NZM12_13370 [Steroidobacteraceae bacterium]|nr:hypothetical protein [Steroidobacteraceae bacterium]MDW8259732.1 hypothetical protein [Gammaproteobacteria bacterium]
MPTLRRGDQWIYGAEFWHDIVPPDGLTPSIGPNFSAIGALAYMHQDGNVRLNYGTGGTKQRACATGLRRLFLHSLDAQIGSMLDQVASSPAYEGGVLVPEGAPTLGARDTATYGPPYLRRLGIWSRRRRTSTMLAEIARQWSLA